MNPYPEPDDPYADLPALYDLEHAAFRDDVELYLRLAEVVGDPILELGCGSGRILVPLAAAGHHITGIDRSRPMLERARRALAAAGQTDRAVVIEAPMSEADRVPGGPFGLVLFSLNGLMHLPTAGEQRAGLAAARRALDPRGMLVIDTLNPTPEQFATMDGRVLHEGSWPRPDRARVDRFSSRMHAPAAQRIDTELWYDLLAADSQLRRVRSGFALRYVFPSELELMLELAGFVEWKLYGSYDLDPLADDSDRLIVTAEVTPSERRSTPLASF